MGEPKYKDWILETIDQLRKRKARPDLERICHMVERKHGLSSPEIEADLERLVETEVVIKVDYKGSTSYRNAAKWRKCHLGGQLLNANEDSRRVATAVRALSDADKATGGDGNGGSSAAEIEIWLLHYEPETTLKERALQLCLDKEIDAGRLDASPGGRYVIGVNPKKTPSKSKSHTSSSGGGSGVSSASKHAQGVAAVTVTTPPSAGVFIDVKPLSAPPTPSSSTKSASPSKKGRPPGTKRKKIKKTLDPAFETSYPVKKSRRDSTGSREDVKSITPILIPQDAPICDYCLLSAACNRNGLAEDLLICKDCRAKAHPSCMEYSEELAKRARTSPWQCIDCKTCYICEDSGDPDAMLFCDACDKGYHMNCHNPPIKDKPTGKWVCSKCVTELGDMEMDTDAAPSGAHERRGIKSERRGTAGLPTPSDSPVQFQDDTVRHESTAKMNGTLPAPIPKLAQIMKLEVPDASDWTIEDVVKFFREMGFPDQADVFREQEIDGKSLLLMKRSDVLTGLALKLGPALKIYAHVQRLQTRGQILLH